MNRHSTAVDTAHFLPVRREAVSEPHAQELNASFDLRCGSAELTNPKELSRGPSTSVYSDRYVHVQCDLRYHCVVPFCDVYWN